MLITSVSHGATGGAAFRLIHPSQKHLGMKEAGSWIRISYLSG